MQDIKVKETYRSYFYFNNERTLSTGVKSELFTVEEPECSIFVDKTRQYDNQVILHRACGSEKLERYLAMFGGGISPEIAIEPSAMTDELKNWLLNKAYSPVYDHEFLELKISDYSECEASGDHVLIERWEHERVDDFFALLQTSGVECSSDIWRMKRSLYCTDTFRCFVAKIGDKPCAWATSFIDDEYAVLANAYTQESHRSRGCQTALLRARIEDAISLGVKVLLTDTMPSSTSSNNCQSVGFHSVGVRSVWSKD